MLDVEHGRLRRSLILLAWALVSCGGDDAGNSGGTGTASGGAAGPVWFEEVAAERGVDFRHEFGEQRFWLPEITGGGLALFDYDDDGDLDLYCVQAGELRPAEGAPPAPSNRLFANRGDGRFVDVTEAAGVGDRGYGVGCTVGDYDADGDQDLYVTNLGANVLYENQGDGTFLDATERASVGSTAWGSSAAFLDCDADGDLDLFVVNYMSWSPEGEFDCKSDYGVPEYCSPKKYDAPARDQLYRNDGDGTFTEVTGAAGLGEAFGNGLGIVWGDMDSDGHVDVYVANDGNPNQLWRGQGGGRFEDDGILTGAAVNGNGVSEAGMGLVLDDLNDDGALDLICTHVRKETNTVYFARGAAYQDATSKSGTGNASYGSTGFGIGHQDFDHDGIGDLHVANGRVNLFRPLLDEARPYAEPDQVFRGLGGGRFEELPQGGLAAPQNTVGRGSAFGDLDGDGDIDVCVIDNGGPLRIYSNIAPKAGGSLLLDVREADGRRALGARLRYALGERVRHRQVQVTTSYASASDARVHVGLGDRAGVEEVTVRWLDGAEEAFGPFEDGARATLTRGQGRSAK